MAFTLGAAPVRSRRGPGGRAIPPVVQYNAAKEAFDKNTTEYKRQRDLGLSPSSKLTLQVHNSAKQMYTLGAELGYWSSAWGNYMIEQTKVLYPYM